MIFEDPSQHRWKTVLYTSLSITVLTGILFLGFMLPEFIIKPVPLNPNLFDDLLDKERGMKSDLGIRIGHNDDDSQRSKKTFITTIDKKQDEIDERIDNIKRLPSILDKKFINAAFIGQNDIIDMRDFETSSKKLDMAFTDWLTLSGTKCEIKENINWRIFEKLKENKVTVIPRFSNSDSILRGIEFFNIIKNEDRATCLIDELKKEVLNRSLKGVNIDIDNVDVTNKSIYTNWLMGLTESFHNDNLYVIVNVPMDSVVYDYKNIGKLADMVIVKAFDEHSVGGKPGPIAGKFWFEENIFNLLKKLPNNKVVVAIGLHSYDWNITTGAQPEIRSFDRTMRLANNISADIKFDDKSGNNSFAYKSADGSLHEIWFLDAISAWNQFAYLRQKKVYGMSLWRIGNEDRTLWSFVDKHENQMALKVIRNKKIEVEPESGINTIKGFLGYENVSNTSISGEGNIIQIPLGEIKDENDEIKTVSDISDEAGAQKIDMSEFCNKVLDSNSLNLWDNYLCLKEDILKYMGLPENTDTSEYDFLPSGFSPVMLGKLPNFEKLDSSGSGEIFKIQRLQKDGEREIVFEGEQIVSSKYEKLPQRIKVSRLGKGQPKTIALTFNDGPDKEYSDKILSILKKNNIKATFFLRNERIVKSPELVKKTYDEGHLLGGHTLFYPDVGVISEDDIKNELNNTQRLIKYITGHGSMLVRAPYNMNDALPIKRDEVNAMYNVSDMGYVLAGATIDSRDFENPSSDIVAQNILSNLKTDESNIVIMHDAGGDRTQTVEALEKVIPAAMAQGYSFVTLNQILDVSRDTVMPQIPFYERFFILGKPIIINNFQAWGWKLIVILFLVTTLLSVLRILFIGLFVLRSNKLQKKYYSDEFQPPVTILVPAYNEEKVIERTIMGLLKSEYPNFEILVIDDGSKDNTAECVQKLAEKYENVRLISKANEGKSLALNLGFKEAKYDYVVTVDADTIVFPKTIHYLIQPFADPKVDAVCGNILVGNVKNILTSFQEVEYVIGQNFDRRAFDALNCISVVPGATGAWRKQKVLDVGGYSTDTLVEDADLTLTILENGGRIVYSPLAKSITEAPEIVHALFKQRFRWSFGTFQCFWKHRSTFGKGPLGLIALPNMILFQVIYPILSPLGDMVLIFAILTGNLKMILAGYIIFLIMDLLASGVAYALDKKSFIHVWVILIQRFYYRQFMYVVTFKSLIAALRGTRYGWNKLERKGTVKLADAS